MPPVKKELAAAPKVKSELPGPSTPRSVSRKSKKAGGDLVPCPDGFGCVAKSVLVRLSILEPRESTELLEQVLKEVDVLKGHLQLAKRLRTGESKNHRVDLRSVMPVDPFTPIDLDSIPDRDHSANTQLLSPLGGMGTGSRGASIESVSPTRFVATSQRRGSTAGPASSPVIDLATASEVDELESWSGLGEDSDDGEGLISGVGDTTKAFSTSSIAKGKSKKNKE